MILIRTLTRRTSGNLGKGVITLSQKESVFSKEEQEYMIHVLKLDFDFSDLSSEEWIQLEDTAGDRLTLHCLDKDHTPSEEGLMCERILDKLP